MDRERKNPRVSVIIPTYNHRDFIPNTLESVFSQTFEDYEIIMVNDGSPDKVGEYLRPLAEAGRINYIEQANQGQAAARNRGLAAARGEFVAFLDDDDMWQPDKLEWQVAAMKESGAETGVLYGQKTELGSKHLEAFPSANAPSGDVLAEFAGAGWIQSPGQTLIRRSALEQAGGFDTNIWGVDDWDLWLRLARVTHFKFVPRVSLIYRRHQSNASINFYRMYLNANKVIRKNFGSQSSNANRSLWKKSRRFAATFTANDGLSLLDRYVTAGEKKKALVCFRQVVQIRPSIAFRRSVLRKVLRVLCQNASNRSASVEKACEAK
jgi:glycosyltransferase involved in cell wall biosynthesis